MNEKYNGWANYETWLTNIWLTEWHLTAADLLSDEEIQEAVQAVTEYDYMRICGRLYERLKDWVDEYAEQCNANMDRCGLLSDLCGAALARVDWYEIADDWLSDLVEEVRTK